LGLFHFLFRGISSPFAVPPTPSSCCSLGPVTPNPSACSRPALKSFFRSCSPLGTPDIPFWCLALCFLLRFAVVVKFFCSTPAFPFAKLPYPTPWDDPPPSSRVSRFPPLFLFPFSLILYFTCTLLPSFPVHGHPHPYVLSCMFNPPLFFGLPDQDHLPSPGSCLQTRTPRNRIYICALCPPPLKCLVSRFFRQSCFPTKYRTEYARSSSFVVLPVFFLPLLSKTPATRPQTPEPHPFRSPTSSPVLLLPQFFPSNFNLSPLSLF